jgi:hypothetical protein
MLGKRSELELEVAKGDPRLVDLLRRSDEEDDRSDLTLAQG